MSTPTPTQKTCDYCTNAPATHAYGACDDCHAYFVEDEITAPPSMWLDGHEVHPDSDLYAHLMNEAARASAGVRVRDRLLVYRVGSTKRGGT